MQFTKTLATVNQNERDNVGQKTMDLALLMEQKFAVPESFVVTSSAFDTVVSENKLKHKINFLLSHVKAESTHSLMNGYTSIRKAVTEAKLTKELLNELKEMYESLTSAGVGLETGNIPLRIIVSVNHVDNSENNDTIIQSIKDVHEFIAAVKEAWALAYLPSQLKPRMDAKYAESGLKIALLVQVMDAPNISVHAYSCLPEDKKKVYLQVYYGNVDLREKVAKDFYAITKNNLAVVANELNVQTGVLEITNGELALIERAAKNKEDKLIKRELEELARLAKKTQTVLQEPTKVFFSVKNEEHTLLWVNRLGFDASAEPVQEPAPQTAIEVVDLANEEDPTETPPEETPPVQVYAEEQTVTAAVAEQEEVPEETQEEPTPQTTVEVEEEPVGQEAELEEEMEPQEPVVTKSDPEYATIEEPEVEGLTYSAIEAEPVEEEPTVAEEVAMQEEEDVEAEAPQTETPTTPEETYETQPMTPEEMTAAETVAAYEEVVEPTPEEAEPVQPVEQAETVSESTEEESVITYEDEPEETPMEHTEVATERAVTEATSVAEHVQESAHQPTETAHLEDLSSQLENAMEMIERKYKALGGEGGTLQQMIEELNQKEAWSRDVDAELLSKAVEAVQRNQPLTREDHETAMEELTFLLE